jgi:hypothetical protein
MIMSKTTPPMLIHREYSTYHFTADIANLGGCHFPPSW